MKGGISMDKANAATMAKRRKVDFAYRSGKAKEVCLRGDFNDWNPKRHPMKQDQNGIWRKYLMLVPGTYEYKLFVDGEWRMDPENPLTCPNPHGTRNNFIVVPDPRA